MSQNTLRNLSFLTQEKRVIICFRHLTHRGEAFGNIKMSCGESYFSKSEFKRKKKIVLSFNPSMTHFKIGSNKLKILIEGQHLFVTWKEGTDVADAPGKARLFVLSHFVEKTRFSGTYYVFKNSILILFIMKQFILS